MTSSTNDSQKLSFWQLIFLQSKVNGTPYCGEELPRHNWDWPQETYLQHRLYYLKESQTPNLASLNRSPQARFELMYRRLLERS